MLLTKKDILQFSKAKVQILQLDNTTWKTFVCPIAHNRTYKEYTIILPKGYDNIIREYPTKKNQSGLQCIDGQIVWRTNRLCVEYLK